MKKEHTTFMQIGKARMIPIPFWLYVAINRLKIKYWALKLWTFRRLGIVYDPDTSISECPYCHEKYKGTYGDHVLRKANDGTKKTTSQDN